MTLSSRLVSPLSVACLLACSTFGYGYLQRADPGEEASKAKLPTGGDTASKDTTRANELIRQQPGFFVPNLGQWDHAASFVHRSGPMTLFLEDRGWVIDLAERPAEPKARAHQSRFIAGRAALGEDEDEGEVEGDKVDRKIHGVALRMTFEGDGRVLKVVGEKRLPGHHNYFLGNDESRWRTGVPLYGSVRYEGLYPGIDLRLREAKGVPEYDLLLQPGADLSQVVVHFEGGNGSSIARDGSLVIETALGPLTQSVPKTWEMSGDGRKREIACNFVLLGASRFGFTAPGWDDDTRLTIDPGLIWSTFLGGNADDELNDLDVDANGLVTVGGSTYSTDFPTKIGAYNRTRHTGLNGYISRLDPRKAGAAQLIYSTFLGGTRTSHVEGVAADSSGVVSLTGITVASNYPTTTGAYATTFPGVVSAFVSRLDPRKAGAAQLVYSTYVGGSGQDYSYALAVGSNGRLTIGGGTTSTNYPTTAGAFRSTRNGSGDLFVSQLDPSKTGKAQLTYSSYLGGSNIENLRKLVVDSSGVVTIVGSTQSSDYPTTTNAFDSTLNGSNDVVVSRLDPSQSGASQLVFSSYLGGGAAERPFGIAVDSAGIVAVTGWTTSSDFPTTGGAYSTTANGGADVFVCQLDARKASSAQLAYSTYLGGAGTDGGRGIDVNSLGILTVTGHTSSSRFPTTQDAFSTVFRGAYDGFVTRLNPKGLGDAQLVKSTYFGGKYYDYPRALAVDSNGFVTIAGRTHSIDLPTTKGAFDTTLGPRGDGFVTRLDMGVALYGDVHELSLKAGGTQKLTVNAGKAHANRLYWIFGSITGTKPGVNLLGVHIPLNPDLYTDVAMGAVNTTVFTKFKGTLDTNGLATASFIVPANLPLPRGFTFHHAYVVYDASGRFYMASNAVPVRLR